ncbi:FtsK/SpoIIIE family DNA translocase [Deinococcus puniceus]|uniref:Cell division protein FtsK n=1 Tax=Deinococcus puniceus TaxID=1182568 RepID=A0A172T8E2_9DEIO|nr:DNA translocase FtsK [Deinococcus puniceus]ANE43214.1 cell division protein FtsK [Deinococcus puniceus]
MSKAVKARKAAAPANRFDGEALGLVLFALGIFLAVTLLLEPPTRTGGETSGSLMAQARELLRGWLGWGAYVLPVVPVAYGVLVFLGRDLANLTRRVLGGVLVTLALLALHEVFEPEAAGKLAEVVMAPLSVVSYVAALIPLVVLTLGLEIMLRLRPLTLLKGFFRQVSVLLGGASANVQGAIEARQEGRDAARTRTEARQGLSAHARDLDTLRKLYPSARELKSQAEEVRAALRELKGLDEAGLKDASRDLDGWRAVTATFVSHAARDLREQVAAEAPDAGAKAEAVMKEISAGRHELSVELASTQASGELESLRRRSVTEVQRLALRAGKLERERKAAEKALAKADAAVLARELPAHSERVAAWAEVSREWIDWQDRERHYLGWPDLAAAFDRAPTEVAGAVAEALRSDPDGTLAAQEQWRARLARAQEDALRRAEAMATPAPITPPSMNFDFTDFGNMDGAQIGGAQATTEQAGAPLEWHKPTRGGGSGSSGAASGGAAISPERPAFAPAPPLSPPLPAGLPPAGPDIFDDEDDSSGHTDSITGELDGLDPWGDDEDMPFSRPEAKAPVRPPAMPAVPTRQKPLLGQGGVQAAPAPWESADAPTQRRRPIPQSLGPQPIGATSPALPSYDLLDPIPQVASNLAALDVAARQRAAVIEQTLRHFGLQARVVDFARGPTVTRYEIEPAPGEKISRIANLSNDLARALAVGGVRIEAPVPGKSVIGLEVPNSEREPVTFHQAAASPGFRNTRAKLPMILGKSIDGELVVGDLAKMPHLLVAGSTGSGKSVCVNTLITSLLFKYLPHELRFLMIDPKMVELTPYDGIAHLVRSVVTNPVDAAGVLLGAVAHMERRYKMMSQVGAKNLEQYNAKMRQVGDVELPHLIIIIDELADLMITSPKEVESAIMRLAQMARATGMHLILATQRPSVDILTSLIKVNVPARIAFAVSSTHDSRTILDSVGAERLTGMGDMLFYQPGHVKPVRLQGPYISEVESARITEELRRQVFEDDFVEAYGSDFEGGVEASGPSNDRANMDFSDPLLRQAAAICIEEGQGSVSRLQRRLSVGHARAGKLMDLLEAMGIVSKHQGSKPRDVLIHETDLPEYFGR